MTQVSVAAPLGGYPEPSQINGFQRIANVEAPYVDWRASILKADWIDWIDARAIHFNKMDVVDVDVELIASLPVIATVMLISSGWD